MLKIIPTYVLVLFICFITFSAFGQRQLEFLYENELSFEQKVIEAEKFFDVQGRGRGTGYKQFLRSAISAAEKTWTEF